ncbi:MAG: sugar phosphate isomerase/epimerase family protein [Planctomycetota bacterium]|jgi:sugar phosphate isomerase/epimerase
MAIKVGFSSMVCPAWDLNTILQQAASMGYDGIELRGLAGSFHLPDVPELVDDPGGIRQLVRETGVQLMCLGCSASFEPRDRKVLATSRRQMTETIELAGKLDCPYVRVFLGNAVGAENRGTLSRVAVELRDLAGFAVRHRTTILVENGGDFVTSQDLWLVIDAVGHPAIQACWNPLNALTRGEKPTVSIPRLGRRIAVCRLSDGQFDAQGRFVGYRPPGEGDADLARAIDLLKGICFQGWLLFEWPKMIASLPEPDEVLPKVIAFVRERLEAKQPVLAAYKGDKQAPNFRAPTATEASSTQ